MAQDKDEAEIFADALSEDISVEQTPTETPEPEATAPEAQAEAAPTEEAPPEPTEAQATEAAPEQPAAETSQEPSEAPQMPENIPSWRLAEEAQKRREALAENEQLKAALGQLQQQVYQMAAQPQGQPQPRQQAPQQQQAWGKGIDPIEDPNGFAAAVVEQATELATRTASQSFEGQLQVVRLENSLARAADRHGEGLNEAYNAFMGAAGNDQATYLRVMNAPDPGEAMVQWHKERNLLAETGGDPTAYRNKMREELLADPEFRKSVIEAAKAEASTSPTPNNVTQVPPSLASVPGGGSPHRGARQTDQDEASIFAEALKGS